MQSYRNFTSDIKFLKPQHNFIQQTVVDISEIRLSMNELLKQLKLR